MSIADNLDKIRSRINTVCEKSARDPQEITLIAVSKGRSINELKEAIIAGAADIAESRLQEAIVKYKEITGFLERNYPGQKKSIRWHMVGHLQTNKVPQAVRIFDLIHSLDSPRLAESISKEALKADKIQDVLVEVNTCGQSGKYGLEPNALRGFLTKISDLPNLNVRGLMTIAGAADKPENARHYFKALKDLARNIDIKALLKQDSPVLSMGMSDDFEAAILEGATMLRLGRIIFKV